MALGAVDGGQRRRIDRVGFKGPFSMPIPNVPPAPRLHACHECGGLYPEEDLLRLGAARVCAP